MRESETTGLGMMGNRLVGALPFDEKIKFESQCTLLTLDAGTVIAEPNSAIRHVYFPNTASISVSATDGYSRRIEGLLIGNEGMFGLPLALGVDKWQLRGSVQCSGSSLCLAANEFKDVYASSPALRRILMRYTLAALTQLARSIVCAAYHSIESRLARWMLMTQDRTCSDTFKITHELLSEVLGVRRAGISVAAASLQQNALIRYRHGHVTILDRAGLEAVACDCYEAVRAIYRANLLSLQPGT